MSVVNGQPANEDTFNNAFASKQDDNTLAGVQSLEHPTSGGNIANLQQTVNDNTDNIATNTADIATNTANIATNTGDIADNTTDIADLRTLTGTTAPEVDLGTFTGVTIPDASTVKSALQALETEVELKINLSEKGAANGVAPLDGASKIDASYLPASVVGALNYQGTWNASTNTPALSSGVGTKGFYYVVSVAGTTTLDGISSWEIGDWVVYNGTAWEKVDNTDVVTSVNSATGAVVLDTDDISEGAGNLYYTEGRVSANASVVANTAKVSADGSINTHSDVDTATNPPALNDALVWDGSNWVPDQVTGSGGGGDKNYITNSGAETDTAGWATYQDAAQSSPINGESGSPTVAITRSTTDPLSGVASFILTKDAANRQGEGWSYDFTIDSADRARVLDVSFDYLVNSGAFVAGNNTTDSDVTVFLFDITNSRLIEPSSKKLFSNSSTIADKYQASFQTSSDSVSYRLILHVASTSAVAYALKIDSVAVSPSRYVYGTPITDWVSYSPTLQGSTTNPNIGSTGTAAGFYRRVGDNLEVRVNFTAAGSGISAGSGSYFVTIPQSLTFDSTKINLTIPDRTGYGSVIVDNTGTNTYYGFVVYRNSTSVAFWLDQFGGGQVGTSVPAANWFNAANDGLSARFSIPIAGFSSSVQISDRFDSRIVTARAQISANRATDASTNVNFDTVTFDDVSGFSSGVYTVRSTGKYRVTLFGATNSGASTFVYFFVYVNGVSRSFIVALNGTSYYNGSALVNVNSGDTISIRSASATTVLYEVGQPAALSIEKVSGSGAIAATDVVSVIANTSTTVATAAVTPINFTNIVDNSHGAYSAGTFTVPAAGRYFINASTYAGATNHTIFVYVDGAIAAQGSPFASVTSAAQVTYVARLNAGQTVQIRSGENATMTGGAAINRLEIIRLGI